jgi:CheY-like chemotaxis protein
MTAQRLLVCDDEPAVGRLVQHVAEDLGYVVQVTTDGESFIRAYDGFKPTTVVLDMVMPGMDGNELILWLAARNSEARLVIITGYTPDYAAHAKILAEFKGIGPVTMLHKPFDVQALRAILAVPYAGQRN